jgi:hypothetical protein
MFVQFVSHLQQFLLSEKTFKERELGPFAKTLQNFMHLSTPFITGDIIGYDIQSALPAFSPLDTVSIPLLVH